MCSVIEPDTSIRQNITAWATGSRVRLEPLVADVERVDVRDHAEPAQLAVELLHQRGAGADRRRSSRSISARSAASSSGFGRRSAIRRDRPLRTVRSSARLAGEPLTE